MLNQKPSFKMQEPVVLLTLGFRANFYIHSQKVFTVRKQERVDAKYLQAGVADLTHKAYCAGIICRLCHCWSLSYKNLHFSPLYSDFLTDMFNASFQF